MEVIKKNKNILAILAFELVLGILLLVNVSGFTKIIFIIIAIFLLVKCVQNVITYLKVPAPQASQTQALTVALLELAAAIGLVAQSDAIISMIPVLSIIYGLLVVAVGLSKVQWAVDLLRAKNERWTLPAIGAAVGLVVGAFILFGLLGEGIRVPVAGICLVGLAVLDLVSLVLASKAASQPAAKPASKSAAAPTAKTEATPAAKPAPASVPKAASNPASASATESSSKAAPKTASKAASAPEPAKAAEPAEPPAADSAE